MSSKRGWIWINRKIISTSSFVYSRRKRTKCFSKLLNEEKGTNNLVEYGYTFVVFLFEFN